MSAFLTEKTLAEPGSLEVITSKIERFGYAVCPRFFDRNLVELLLNEANALWSDGDFRQATVGHGTKRKLRREIRNDQLFWLVESKLTPAQSVYWERMKELSEYLNAALFLGLFEFEAHFARFPAGGFYKPHLDRHRGTSERMLSVVVYLDPEWYPADGGHLRIYTDRSARASGPHLDVIPEAGKMVIFLSGEVWHEVLPASKPRHSITGWFRRRKMV